MRLQCTQLIKQIRDSVHYLGHLQVEASAKELSEFDSVDQVCTTWDTAGKQWI